MDCPGSWLSHTQRKARKGSIEPSTTARHMRTSGSVSEFCRQSEDIRRVLQGLRSREEATGRDTLREVSMNREVPSLRETVEKYEREAEMREVEIARLRQELQEMKGQRPSSGAENQAKVLLSQVCSLLGLKDQHQLLPCVRKLLKGQGQAQEVSEALTAISHFVCPDQLEVSTPQLIAAVRRWKEERTTSPNAHSEDLIQHIRQVFSLKPTDSVREFISHLFLQIHELKAFARQIRQALGLDADTPLRTVTAFVKTANRR